MAVSYFIFYFFIFFKILYDGTILDLSGIKRAREVNLYDVWGELNNYNRELLQDVKKKLFVCLKKSLIMGSYPFNSAQFR